MAGRIAYLGNISPQGLVLDLDAGIKGSYPGSGTIWSDISNNRNNGTLINGPLYTGSNYGAIVFDGTDDYVLVPNTLQVGQTTVNTWFNTKVTGSENIVVGWGDNTYLSQFNIFLSGSTASVKVRDNSSVTNTLYATGKHTGSWVNATAINNTNLLTFYINGSPVNSTATSYGSFLPKKIQLGQYDVLAYTMYSGSIANTQIYNQALTQFQVWQNFNAYKSRYGIPDIVTNGLVLNLDAGNPYSYLSGSSGTTWTNTVAVSSSISGSLINGPIYSNGGITLGGTNDYIRVNKLNSMSSFTLSFWFTVSAFVGESFLIITSNDAQGPGFGNSGNKLTWWDGSIAAGVYGVGTTILQTNKVYNAVYVRNNTTGIKTMYLNTQIEFTGSAVNTFPNVDFSMGYYPESSRGNLNGTLYSSQIYNRALSQDEITQNFNALRGRYGI